MKKFKVLVIAVAVAITAQAGGLLHNTNQHIAFQRMMARGASNEIDAVFTNPAGIAFMDHDGWTLSLNIQSAYQTRNINATVMTPAGMGLFPNDTFNKKYKGNAAAPILPSAYAVYKTPKWAISGFIGVVGGGGKCTFDDGLPLFDAAVMAGTYSRSLQPLAEGYPSLAAVLGAPITPDQYYIDGYMKGRQYIFGGQLGFSYKFNEHFSGYAGFRVNYFNGNYTGHVNATAGDILSNKFQQLAISYPAFAPELLPKTEENGLVHIAIDCSQTGWGLTPIVGLNYKWRGLTLAAKYEFKTNLNIENDTKVLEAKGFEEQMKDYKHGVNTPSDMPSVLYVAAGYEFIPNKLRGTVEYHYYDDKHADMASNKNKELKHGTHEFLAGVEWDINKTFTVSAGAQRTDYGLSDKYQSNTSFSCDSYSIGLGGAINVSKNVKLNVGYFWTTYSDYKKEMPAEAGGYNGISPAITGSDVYSRTNKVFGVGIDYKF
jgi:long-chain fatty acid transport protein